MADTPAWATYPVTHRTQELQKITAWMGAGESGAVVGLVGCGRSNLLNFLCRRPDVLQRYLPEQASRLILVPVDIYNLPANDLSSLYRTMLHSFYWLREQFTTEIKQAVNTLYLENRAVQDPFLSQKALYDLLRLLQERQFRVVLVLNRFDRFCEVATPQMINTLRGLRDNFKDMLSYLVGMIQEVGYLADPMALGDMYELLDTHVCWVGSMTVADAHDMLTHVLRPASSAPDETAVAAMLRLSGCFPSLLKAVGQWWLLGGAGSMPTADWAPLLLEEKVIQYRLERIWNGLTQEEKLALAELQKGAWLETRAHLATQQAHTLARLSAKGLCQQDAQDWRIASELLAAYVGGLEGRVRGKIWLDEAARVIHQGQEPLTDLIGLQYEILRFLTKNPYIRHTRDDIIDNAWPEEEQREGITPNALQVHIASIRKKIEPNPALPRYLLTWHGRPGGYQFFPEGKPE